MDPSYDPQFFNEFLSGRATEMKPMVSLLAQVFAILVGGIILWRISAVFGKKNKNRRQSMFESSQYQQWKNKR
jgi:predicted permease